MRSISNVLSILVLVFFEGLRPRAGTTPARVGSRDGAHLRGS